MFNPIASASKVFKQILLKGQGGNNFLSVLLTELEENFTVITNTEEAMAGLTTLSTAVKKVKWYNTFEK